MAAVQAAAPSGSTGSMATGFFVGALCLLVLIIILANVLPAPPPDCPRYASPAPSPV